MAYSSKVAVEYKHHKVNVCVTFLCPRNTSISRVSRGAGMRVPQEKSVEDKIMGQSHQLFFQTMAFGFFMPLFRLLDA